MRLEEMDRDGALAAALDGYTRAQVLRAAALGAGAAGLLAGPAAASTSTDMVVLQLALVLERLGVAFYGEAVDAGKLTGETLAFAKTVHGHERAHEAFVERTIRALGGTPHAAPAFDFGDTTADPARFRKAASSLEELCVEALNGAGTVVSKAVLKGAGQLVSVEARHVAWIRSIRKVDVVPDSFDTQIGIQQAKRRLKATGFVKSGV